MRVIIFPYSTYRSTPSPIIPLQVRGPKGWKQIWAYVDSGAAISIFAEDEARRLALEVERGELTYSMVGDGSLIPVYVHRLTMRIGQETITAPIGFSPKLGVGFNLLGRQGIFTHFDVTFSDATRTVTFRPHP